MNLEILSEVHNMLNYEYIDNRKSESIVLLHGYGGNCNCFKKQLDLLNTLFNIVLIDLHGHGKSKHLHLVPSQDFSFETIASDIHKLLTRLHISCAHFMGLSLGTMVANAYAFHYPNNVLSILNVGAIIKLKPINYKIMKLIYRSRNYVPHMFVYLAAGFVIMPRKKHRKARKIFVTEAKKMDSKDFFAWSKLIIDFGSSYPSGKLDLNIPALYISGASDYVFIKEVKEHCQHCKRSQLYILENTGHVCNIDDPVSFNTVMYGYYQFLKQKNREGLQGS